MSKDSGEGDKAVPASAPAGGSVNNLIWIPRDGRPARKRRKHVNAKVRQHLQGVIYPDRSGLPFFPAAPPHHIRFFFFMYVLPHWRFLCRMQQQQKQRCSLISKLTNISKRSVFVRVYYISLVIEIFTKIYMNTNHPLTKESEKHWKTWNFCFLCVEIEEILWHPSFVFLATGQKWS